MCHAKLHFLILTWTVTECISVFAFPFFLGTPIGITSSEIGLKICAITAGFKKYKSIIKNKRNKHGKLLFLAN